MNDLIEKYFKGNEGGENLFYPPATKEQVKELENQLGCDLPQDYKDFLLTSNGFEGFIGDFYAILEPVEKIYEDTNTSCSEFFPWAIYIGSNGSSEMCVIDKGANPKTFGILPYIGKDEDYISLGETFESFINRLYDDTVFNA